MKNYFRFDLQSLQRFKTCGCHSVAILYLSENKANSKGYYLRFFSCSVLIHVVKTTDIEPGLFTVRLSELIFFGVFEAKYGRV